jgi:hypothetical protein
MGRGDNRQGKKMRQRKARNKKKARTKRRIAEAKKKK